MRTRTYIHAGKGCSPETMEYMQKAFNMMSKVQNCQNYNYGGYQPNPSNNYYPPINPPSGYIPPTGGGYVYPDRSGWCG